MVGPAAAQFHFKNHVLHSPRLEEAGGWSRQTAWGGDTQLLPVHSLSLSVSLSLCISMCLHFYLQVGLENCCYIMYSDLGLGVTKGP